MASPNPRLVPNKPPAASQETRRRIVSGARAHFLAQGFRRVTMDDLAEELGMSKKTLYAHFPGKKELIEAVLADKFDGLNAELARIAHQAGSDFSGAVQALLSTLQKETAEVRPAFVQDIRREAPEIFKVVETRRREAIQKYFGQLFSAGRKAGIIRSDIPVWLMIEILIAATDGLMNPERMSELELTPKSGFGAIVAVILEGVLSR
jgi:AcrR family transcriptional regulator